MQVNPSRDALPELDVPVIHQPTLPTSHHHDRHHRGEVERCMSMASVSFKQKNKNKDKKQEAAKGGEEAH